MTMVARKQMLGTAPRTLVEECRSILAQEVIPDLVAELPWLDGLIALGDD